jgi:hypothetical protein
MAGRAGTTTGPQTGCSGHSLTAFIFYRMAAMHHLMSGVELKFAVSSKQPFDGLPRN